jgi:hypothetical protein
MRIRRAAARTVFVGLVVLLWLPIVVVAAYAVASALVVPRLSESRLSEALCEVKAKSITFILEMAPTVKGTTLRSMQELSDFVDENCTRISDSPKSEDYRCPCDKTGELFSYEVLVTGLDGTGDDKTTPVLREVHPNHDGRRVVVFKDGHVEFVQDGSGR